jgi:hypothetical protein
LRVTGVPIPPLTWQVSAHEETIKHLRILLGKKAETQGEFVKRFQEIWKSRLNSSKKQ